LISLSITGPLPAIYHIFANLYFVGGLAVGMAVLREVYRDWRPGYVSAVYDLLLIAVTLFFTLGIVFYLSTLSPA
jgi:hypothetical protein